MISDSGVASALARYPRLESVVTPCYYLPQQSNSICASMLFSFEIHLPGPVMYIAGLLK